MVGVKELTVIDVAPRLFVPVVVMVCVVAPPYPMTSVDPVGNAACSAVTEIEVIAEFPVAAVRETATPLGDTTRWFMMPTAEPALFQRFLSKDMPPLSVMIL